MWVILSGSTTDISCIKSEEKKIFYFLHILLLFSFFIYNQTLTTIAMDTTCPILENGTYAVSWIYVSKHKSTWLPLYLNSYPYSVDIWWLCIYLARKLKFTVWLSFYLLLVKRSITVSTCNNNNKSMQYTNSYNWYLVKWLRIIDYVTQTDSASVSWPFG